MGALSTDGSNGAQANLRESWPTGVNAKAAKENGRFHMRTNIAYAYQPVHHPNQEIAVCGDWTGSGSVSEGDPAYEATLNDDS